jgi:hypothetical protein
MSWGIEVTGTPSEVVAKVNAYLDAVVASYEGKEEAKDVVAVKERIESLISAMNFNSFDNGVSVKANGSHSTDAGKINSANLSCSVQRTSLAL